MKVKRIDRNNEVYYTKFGNRIIIKNYINAHDFDVMFDDGHLQHCTSFDHVKSGNIINKLDKTVLNVGYIGLGDYTSKHESYGVWMKMLARCYDNEDGKFSITYDICYVDDEWLCFQNFAKWYDDNKYEIDERLEIDKDIKKKGNNIYSPNNCLLVPSTINKLFIKQQTHRGEYPIGVSLCKRNNKLEVRCRDYLNNKKYFLGYFDTDKEVEAFNTYKEFKEQQIKNMANFYKNKIPVELYNCMINYTIDIDD